MKTFVDARGVACLTVQTTLDAMGNRSVLGRKVEGYNPSKPGLWAMPPHLPTCTEWPKWILYPLPEPLPQVDYRQPECVQPNTTGSKRIQSYLKVFCRAWDSQLEGKLMRAVTAMYQDKQHSHIKPNKILILRAPHKMVEWDVTKFKLVNSKWSPYCGKKWRNKRHNPLPRELRKQDPKHYEIKGKLYARYLGEQHWSQEHAGDYHGQNTGENPSIKRYPTVPYSPVRDAGFKDWQQLEDYAFERLDAKLNAKSNRSRKWAQYPRHRVEGADPFDGIEFKRFTQPEQLRKIPVSRERFMEYGIEVRKFIEPGADSDTTPWPEYHTLADFIEGKPFEVVRIPVYVKGKGITGVRAPRCEDLEKFPGLHRDGKKWMARFVRTESYIVISGNELLVIDQRATSDFKSKVPRFIRNEWDIREAMRGPRPAVTPMNLPPPEPKKGKPLTQWQKYQNGIKLLIATGKLPGVTSTGRIFTMPRTDDLWRTILDSGTQWKWYDLDGEYQIKAKPSQALADAKAAPRGRDAFQTLLATLRRAVFNAVTTAAVRVAMANARRSADDKWDQMMAANEAAKVTAKRIERTARTAWEARTGAEFEEDTITPLRFAYYASGWDAGRISLEEFWYLARGEAPADPRKVPPYRRPGTEYPEANARREERIQGASKGGYRLGKPLSKGDSLAAYRVKPETGSYTELLDYQGRPYYVTNFPERAQPMTGDEFEKLCAEQPIVVTGSESGPPESHPKYEMTFIAPSRRLAWDEPWIYGRSLPPWPTLYQGNVHAPKLWPMGAMLAKDGSQVEDRPLGHSLGDEVLRRQLRGRETSAGTMWTAWRLSDADNSNRSGPAPMLGNSDDRIDHKRTTEPHPDFRARREQGLFVGFIRNFDISF